MNTNHQDENQDQAHGNGIFNSILAGGIGYLLGRGNSSSVIEDGGGTDVVVYPGYAQYLDSILLTLNQSQLISLTMAMIKCTYLRSLIYLDSDHRVQHDKRSLTHLKRCASISLKTPFATKIVVYQVNGGLGESLLLTDGNFGTKTMKVVANPDGSSFIKRGVKDILSTIFDTTTFEQEVDLVSSKRVGRHNRFNLSPKATLFEALAFNNKDVNDFKGLEEAMNLYYAAIITNLSPRTRTAVLSSDFMLNGFCTLNYKDDGCGYLTNFANIY